MPKIKVRTDWKMINTNESVTPAAHAFVFKNTGTCTVFINNQPLLPGEYIGDDSSQLINVQAMQPAVKFERDKAYDIRFADHTNTSFQPDSAEVIVNPKRRALFLTQTFYTIET